MTDTDRLTHLARMDHDSFEALLLHAKRTNSPDLKPIILDAARKLTQNAFPSRTVYAHPTYGTSNAELTIIIEFDDFTAAHIHPIFIQYYGQRLWIVSYGDGALNMEHPETLKDALAFAVHTIKDIARLLLEEIGPTYR